MNIFNSIRIRDLVPHTQAAAAKVGSIVRFTLTEPIPRDDNHQSVAVVGMRARFHSDQAPEGIVIVEGDTKGQFKHVSNNMPVVEIDAIADMVVQNLEPLGRRFLTQTTPGGVYMVAEFEGPCLAVTGQQNTLLGYMILSGQKRGEIIQECQPVAYLGIVSVQEQDKGPR